MLPMPQQGTTPTISPTPITVTPHLCHYKRCVIVGGMGGVNPHYCNHTLAITVLLLQDGEQGLGSDGHDPNRAQRRYQWG